MDQVSAMLKAAEVLAPEDAKRSQREPVTTATLRKIKEVLDLDNSLDAAFWACATSLFWSMARLGELIPKTLSLQFDPKLHVSMANIREVERDGASVCVIHPPVTKCNPKGEDLFWATQANEVDPRMAFNNHIRINKPSSAEFLFSHRLNGLHRPLSRGVFLKRFTKALKDATLPKLQGHSFRIGGTLEYLLRGLPFEVVKQKGCWTSNAFALYLRCHAEVMVPYMQDKPELHTELISSCVLIPLR